MILRRRFVVEDVEARGDDPPVGQSGGQRGLVHDPAAGGVDDDGAGLKAGKLFCAKDRPAGLRHVHRNDVGPGKSVGQRSDGRNRPFRPSAFSQEGIESPDFHAEACRHPRQMTSASTVADDEQALARNLAGLQAVAPLPGTAAHRSDRRGSACLAQARMSIIACSATESEFTSPTMQSGIRRLFSAATSTES